jgi:hypothetical protein
LKASAQPGTWQNRLSEPVVTLSTIQSAVLRLLAVHRDSESDVTGAAPLNPGNMIVWAVHSVI